MVRKAEAGSPTANCAILGCDDCSKGLQRNRPIRRTRRAGLNAGGCFLRVRVPCNPGSLLTEFAAVSPRAGELEFPSICHSAVPAKGLSAPSECFVVSPVSVAATSVHRTAAYFAAGAEVFAFLTTRSIAARGLNFAMEVRERRVASPGQQGAMPGRHRKRGKRPANLPLSSPFVSRSPPKDEAGGPWKQRSCKQACSSFSPIRRAGSIPYFM